jgi:hypothetical protein
MSTNKMNKVIDLYEELIMEHGDETLKSIIDSKDFKKKLLAASGRKKLKKTKDPDEPKKPTTGWLLFCGETRAQLMAENPGTKQSELSKMMSPMWKKLQESKDPDDVARVAGYLKTVEQERATYNSSKKKAKEEALPKKPRNAYQLFAKEERANIKIEGESWGTTTKRISEAWKSLKEEDSEKVDEYKSRVKNWGSDDEASSSDTDRPEEGGDDGTGSEADDDSVVNNLMLTDADIDIETVLEKMQQDEHEAMSEWDNDYMIDAFNKIYSKEDTTKAVGEVVDIENGTIKFYEEKPKPKPKPKPKAKANSESETKQRRPKCKKASSKASI